MNKKGIKNFFSGILSILSFICLTLLILIAVFLIYYIVSNQIAKTKGIRPYISLYTIVSPSMEPNIKVYDVILDTRVKNESELKEKDIITFYSNTIDTGGYTITHRIHDVYVSDGKTYYITKGDNNQNPDEGMITFNDVVGKVRFVLPALGKLQLFISSKFGWVVIILIPALGIILADIKKLIKLFRIKEQIEDIPQSEEIAIMREREEDKRLRAAVEKADNLNKRKE